jgi:hypothetical protein
VKALASVEELSFNSPITIDAIKEVMGLDGCIYLPKLQVLQVAYVISLNLNLVGDTLTLLESREGLSRASHNIVPLEKFVLWLTLRGKCPDEVLELKHVLPSFAQVYINGSALERLIPSIRLSCYPDENSCLYRIFRTLEIFQSESKVFIIIQNKKAKKNK